jgi:hypothetical protein
LSEPVKKADYDPEDLAAIKLAEEQKKAADLAAQTQSIHTRNREFWKTTNRDILEQHCVTEGMDFTKEAIDAAHAMYVKELQDIDEKKAQEEKAKEEAAKEAARKAAETAVTPTSTPTITPPQTTTPTVTPTPDPSTKPLDEETRTLLELAPHLPDVVITMWNHASLGKGTGPLIAAVERDFKAHLPLLAQEVYQASKASKGDDGVLQGLVKRYTPHPTTHQTTTVTPTVTPTSTPTIPPQDPNSSTNQAQLPNSVPEGGVKVGVDGGAMVVVVGSTVGPR